MYLAGDIGGTKTHLAICKQNANTFVILQQEKFPSAAYPGLEEIILEFCKKVKEPIQKACFGVAGPIFQGRCETPNLSWIIDVKKLQNTLKIEKVDLINDLVANAYGLNCLSEKDFFVLNKGEEVAHGHRAMISAGTGLGEAGLFFDGTTYRPLPSEGGHGDFSLRSEEDIELFRYLKKKYNSHVSMERVLSGPGLENIYHYLVEKTKTAPQGAKELNGLAQKISEKALNHSCQICEKALEMFISFYGAEAGNTALRYYALGGVFLGGGIAPKILEKLKEPMFMKAFSSKGRLQSFLNKIPVKVVLHEETALLGSAYYAQHFL